MQIRLEAVAASLQGVTVGATFHDHPGGAPVSNPVYTPIYVSSGFKRLVGGTITEITGKDISADTFTIALGSSGTTPPSSGWVTPTTNTIGAGLPLPNQYGVAIPAVAQRIVLLLVDNATSLGTYHVWGKIPDSPEIEPVWLAGPITVA
jgi:hypothetical protein